MTAPVFDQTYQHYLELIGGIDLATAAARLGFVVQQETALIPIFNRVYHVSRQAITDSEGRRAEFDACVIISKYLLHTAPATPPGTDFATFKDFKDAGPLTVYFKANAEGVVANAFSGRVDALAHACENLGGRSHDADWNYQLKYVFQGLPLLPVYLLFNDSEEGFPAQCTLLFQQSAGHYLDMESLAVLGARLARLLVQG